MEKERVTGIILAGGKSRRFGSNKALYRHNGKCLVEYSIDVLRPVCNELILITNNPADFSFTGLTIYEDIHKDCGPLAGIHTGLVHSKNLNNLIISCDSPELHTDLFRAILENRENYQVVMPTHNGIKESMASFFHKNSIPLIEAAIATNCLKVFNAIMPMTTLFLDVSKMPFYSEQLFANINTKEALNSINDTNND
ncbi:molybdenum cofactor guanylyltransferase [Williamwhitmania taraxaci]|uniref:Probable molybdenum cofactor guanylyltransferase n=1 Tax=Williamwhitmania taraxaci TaxID=1640674 RepID=A0A1G6KVY1_9BACT|nr:molybdenum cofactor guanylyltransferase [Williamwhitmania taraxaci]SDC35240.1 molybdenum cofactor guanylyltransferase [Williamwhitmania taraxaci]